jgi:hypothetical protein
MTKQSLSTLLFCLALSLSAIAAENKGHQWLIGKILDEGRARDFTGIANNSSSSTTAGGSANGSADSTSFGASTSTTPGAAPSGTSKTSNAGLSSPFYRVHENLLLEGSDTVYVTSERVLWRRSKSAHVAVNGEVRYYVDGRNLHILDEDGKEHTVSIIKEIKKSPSHETTAAWPTVPDAPATNASSAFAPSEQPAAPLAVPTASVLIDSKPSGADIEIDGAFVGNTPSSVDLSMGDHAVRISRKGFRSYEKKIHVSGGKINLSPVLVPVQKK